MFSRLRGAILTAVASASVLILVGSTVPSAAADEDDTIPVDVDLTAWTLGADAQPTPVVMNPVGEITIELDADRIPKPQCSGFDPAPETATSDGWRYCIGAPTESPSEPITILGGVPATISPSGSPEVREALDWIVEEAVEAIHVVYGVPLDARIRVYAAADIRAYVHNRILDILDRAAYGIELTPKERLTFDLVQRAILDGDRVAAHAAKQEYDAFVREGCAYQPPDAPAFVADPVRMPDSVLAWCARPALGHAFDGIPPRPTVEHFQAWGAYRSADALGLSRLNQFEARDALAAAVAGGVAFGGIAVAIAGAAAAGALVGSSAALSSGVATAIGSAIMLNGASAAMGSGIGSAIAAIGAVAAASVVAAVLIAVAITAVKVIQLIEHEQVGTTLQSIVDAADAANDPFGIEALRAQLQGLELRSALTPEAVPQYRSQSSAARLAQLVSYWLATTPTGAVIPDPVGVWEDHESTDRDFQFELHDGEQTWTSQSIELPGVDGPIQVRFNRGWLIVTSAGGAPRAALWFRYVQPDGEPAIAARSVTPDGGWIITTSAAGAPAPSGERRTFLEYVDAEGRTVMVRIVNPAPPLAGPHPTVAGPLLPGRVAFLRPNPLSVDGSFDLDRYRDGYDYAWTVERLDPDTDQWVAVSITNADQYGAKFVPEHVGAYRAVVTMIDRLEPGAAPMHGEVGFRIEEPVIHVDELALHDNGGSELRVAVQFAEMVPSDLIDVTVRWPGDLGQDVRPESTLQLACHRDEFTCQTVRSDDFPDERAALTHTLSPYADLSQGVTVTVRNSYGGAFTRTFPIDHPDRPRLAASQAQPADDQLGSVYFNAGTIAVHLVAEADENPNYVLATVIPGDSAFDDVTFGFYDPVTNRIENIITLLDDRVALGIDYDSGLGAWVLGLWGTPRLEDVQTLSVPLVVQQDNGARIPFLLNLEIAPSPADQFRAVLADSIDPGNIAVASLPELPALVIGGRSDWGGFDGQFCVTLRNVNTMIEAAVRCAAASDFVGEGDRIPFPYRALFPTGLAAGMYEVGARLEATGAVVEERVYEGMFRRFFVLEHGAPRIVSLNWQQSSSTAVLQLDAAAAQITAVACELDGVPVECWTGSGGIWTPPGLQPGDHHLEVWVDAADGNFTSGALNFTVSDETDAPPVDPGGSDPPPPDGGGSDADGSEGSPGPGLGGSLDGSVPVSGGSGAAREDGAQDLAHDGGASSGKPAHGAGGRPDEHDAARPAAPDDETDRPDAAAASGDPVSATPWLVAGLLLVVVVAIGSVLLARRRTG